MEKKDEKPPQKAVRKPISFISKVMTPQVRLNHPSP
jgi:hypothetical protein